MRGKAGHHQPVRSAGWAVEGIPFWQAIILAMDGAITHANRFADEESVRPPNARIRSARNCLKSRTPARSLRSRRSMHDAASLRLLQDAVLYRKRIMPMGPSCIDRWLWPFCEKDIRKGITKDEAVSLLEELYIWLAESAHYYTSGVLDWYSGAGSFHQLTVGAASAKTTSIYDQHLTYMCLGAHQHHRDFFPTFRFACVLPDPAAGPGSGKGCLEVVAQAAGSRPSAGDDALSQP